MKKDIARNLVKTRNRRTIRNDSARHQEKAWNRV